MNEGTGNGKDSAYKKGFKDAPVAVSLSKHMRGEPSGGILQEQKDDLSKSNRVIIYM